MTVLQIIFYTTGIMFFTCKFLSWLVELIKKFNEWADYYENN